MMALVTCRECKAEVSSEAKVCPKCGIDQPHRKPPASNAKQAVRLLVVIVGLVLLQKTCNQHVADEASSTRASNSSSTASTATPTTTPAASTVPTAKTPVAAPPAPKLGAQWSYSHNEDPMGKGTVHQADVTSSNTVDFSFPYSGEQHGTLTLRTHPRFGRDVIFAIRKGQILCRSYEDCQVLVRFDDEPPVNYAGRGPSDNSTEMVFILSYDKFVSRLMKAKRVRIAPSIYHQGSPIFEFNVEGFDPKSYRPAG
jgi:hypothetical protein